MKKKIIKLTLIATMLTLTMFCVACGNKSSDTDDVSNADTAQAMTDDTTVNTEEVVGATDTITETEAIAETEVASNLVSGSYVVPNSVSADEAEELLARSEELKHSPELVEMLEMTNYPFTVDDLVSDEQRVYDDVTEYYYYFNHSDCVAGLQLYNGNTVPMVMDICNSYGSSYPVVIFNNFDRSPSNAQAIYDALVHNGCWYPYVTSDYKEGDTSITVTYPETGESMTIEL